MTTSVWVSWITAQLDFTEHAVTDEAQVEAHDGRFASVCGERFFPASMNVGPQRGCLRCIAFLEARARMRPIAERLDRPGWWSRLFCTRKQPVDVGGPQESQKTPTSAGPQRSMGAACASHRQSRAPRGRHAA